MYGAVMMGRIRLQNPSLGSVYATLQKPLIQKHGVIPWPTDLDAILGLKIQQRTTPGTHLYTFPGQNSNALNVRFLDLLVPLC